MSRLVMAVAVMGLVGCVSQTPAVRAAEPLYLALEVSENGHTVASPKVLGFEGRSITAERRSPGAEYRLVMRPQESGIGYRVSLDLELPSGKHVGGRLKLLHGEERIISLDATTELTVLLMRVDSPEFKALMAVDPQRPASI
jgi:hypothetical protein